MSDERAPIQDRIPDGHTLDTTALVADLDRDGFDFTPYIIPEDPEGGSDE